MLPENRKMVQVFRDAGYTVAGGYEDGVMRLVFPIDSTDTSVSVMQAREHRAESASIERFFHARSVAVIGASRRHDTIGQTLVRNLVLGDYQGRVYVVNPAAQSVAGLPAYATVGDIPDTVDVAIVAVPAEAVQDVVLDCAAKGVHGLVVISSGFAETGEEGRIRQRQLVGLARSYGLRLVGPNCLGIINTASDYSLNASLSTVMPPRGRAGFFCQSGALGVAILEKVARRGLGLSTFVSAGNRADVSGNDLLQYWEEDDDTEVVLLYLESIGNPRKFSRLARRVSSRKPVIAVKSGPVHPGRADGPRGALDAGPAGRRGRDVPAGRGDPGRHPRRDVRRRPARRPPAAARAAAGSRWSATPTRWACSPPTRRSRSASRSPSWSRSAPDATAEDFEEALDAAIDDDEVDSVVAVFIPPLNTTGEEVADVLAAVGEQSDKPLVSTFLASEGIPELLRVPDVAGSTAGRGSVPSYPAVEAAVRALARVVEYAAWRAKPLGELVAPDSVDTMAARSLVVEDPRAPTTAGAT